MADDDLNFDDGENTGSASSQKGGKMGGLLPTILKWAAIAVGAIILTVSFVFISLSIINSNAPSTTAVPVSQDYQLKRPEY